MRMHILQLQNVKHLAINSSLNSMSARKFHRSSNNVKSMTVQQDQSMNLYNFN